jgi:aryl-alcohol dehydrogenase-like predicted oxidoreductase
MPTIGSTDLDVFPLCLGGNVFGWTVDRDEAFAVLDAYLDGGGNFLDTADTYASWVPGNRGGESEAVIGEWMESRGVRDRVIVATKVGMWDEHLGLSAPNVRAAAGTRCGACAPTTSTSTTPTRTTPTCRWRRRSARSTS